MSFCPGVYVLVESAIAASRIRPNSCFDSENTAGCRVWRSSPIRRDGYDAEEGYHKAKAFIYQRNHSKGYIKAQSEDYAEEQLPGRF